MRICKKCGASMPPLPIRKHCEACRSEITRLQVVNWRKNNKDRANVLHNCYLVRLQLRNALTKIEWFHEKYPDYNIRKTRAMYDYWLCEADRLAHRLNKLANVL